MFLKKCTLLLAATMIFTILINAAPTTSSAAQGTATQGAEQSAAGISHNWQTVATTPSGRATWYIDDNDVLWGMGGSHVTEIGNVLLLGDGIAQRRTEFVKIMENVQYIAFVNDGMTTCTFFFAGVISNGNLYMWGKIAVDSFTSNGETTRHYTLNSDTPVRILDDVVFTNFAGGLIR